jgi:hypothetical protein
MILEEDPSYDWEGSLYGECMECNMPAFLKEHPQYKDIDEAQRNYFWRKEASKRHASRRDTKLRDEKRVRLAKWEDLIKEAESIHDSRSAARRAVLTFLKETTKSIVDSAIPGMREKLEKIFKSYQAVKTREAQDQDYIAQPGDVVSILKGDQKYLLQLLDRVSPTTRRFFICRRCVVRKRVFMLVRALVSYEEHWGCTAVRIRP